MEDELQSLALEEWLALNLKVYRTVKEKHETMMQDKERDIQE